MAEIQVDKQLDPLSLEPKDKSNQVWAKLNSLTKKVKGAEIKAEVLSIGRAPDNDVSVKDQRLSGKHCKIMRKIDNDGKMVVVLEDTSSNGTYLNGQIIGKGQFRELKNGDEIVLLKSCEQVDEKDEIGFIFVVLVDYSKVESNSQQKDEDNQKKRNQTDISISKEDHEKKQQEELQMKKNISSMADQFDCGICYMTMHQAVSLMPCLHAFCGGCFSDWMQRQKDCPSCRELVVEVKKNSLVNSLIESYLKLNPQLKREDKDIEELEKRNIFKNDVFKLDQAKKEEEKPVAVIKPEEPESSSEDSSSEEEEVQVNKNLRARQQAKPNAIQKNKVSPAAVARNKRVQPKPKPVAVKKGRKVN